MQYSEPKETLPALRKSMLPALREQVTPTVFAKLIAVIPPKVSCRDERRRVDLADLGNKLDVFA